ncbi:MAG: cytochrome c [Kofleriaceae bacterium]|nr:MAG: cytochrome c [Kofleriaceae bacterium]
MFLGGAVAGAACGSSSPQAPDPDAAVADDAHPAPDADVTPPAKACVEVPQLPYTGGEKTFREMCVACHTIGDGAHRAPDLQDVHLRRTRPWMMQLMINPDTWTETDPDARALAAGWGYVMPDFGFDGPTGRAVLDWMQSVNAVGVTPRAPMTLSDAQFTEAKQMYFDRCAGCHGTYRAGATGPDIGTTRARWMGTDSIVATLHWGTPARRAACRRGATTACSIRRRSSAWRRSCSSTRRRRRRGRSPRSGRAGSWWCRSPSGRRRRRTRVTGRTSSR